MKRIALFPGSFDPFTVGHLDIVRRGLALADEVVIAIGVNEKKHYSRPLDERLETIRRLFQDEPRVRIETYQQLTVDYASAVGASFMLRGVRSVADFEYERAIAEVNRQLTGIETVLLFADPRYASVSSSVVRELEAFGKADYAAPFLP